MDPRVKICVAGAVALVLGAALLFWRASATSGRSGPRPGVDIPMRGM